MREIHLTAQDIQKYMDTSDLSEDYLLWMESIEAHLSGCVKCQEALQEASVFDSICQEDCFETALKLAAHEEEIRRSILVCKLQQMQEQARMAEVIRVLQTNTVTPFTLRVSDLQRRAGVARGDEQSKLPTGQCTHMSDTIEMTWENEKLVVKISKQDNTQQPSVLLDWKDKEPIVREACWDEQHEQWIAEFPISNPEETFEVYII